jgi:hypothetical protein
MTIRRKIELLKELEAIVARWQSAGISTFLCNELKNTMQVPAKDLIELKDHLWVDAKKLGTMPNAYFEGAWWYSHAPERLQCVRDTIKRLEGYVNRDTRHELKRSRIQP